MVRMTIQVRWIGCGRQALVKFCTALNMPSPMCRSAFYDHAKALNRATVEVDERRMCIGAAAVRLLHGAKDAVADVAVTFDGTWMRRGFCSLYGVAMSFDTRKPGVRLPLHLSTANNAQCGRAGEPRVK